MTDKEKKVVFTVIGIAILILVIVVCVKMFGNGGKEPQNTPTGNQVSGENVQNEEKYVTTLDDGTKLNKSEDLKNVKKYKNIEISNIQITSANGNTVILADAKNTGNTAFEKEIVKLTLIGENGETIAELKPVIPSIEPGATEQFDHTITADLANMKDFKVEAI